MFIKFIDISKDYYTNQNTEYNAFLIIEENRAGAYIAYAYSRMPAQAFEKAVAEKETFYPCNMAIYPKENFDASSIEECGKNLLGFRFTRFSSIVDTDPKDLGFYIPKQFENKEPVYEEVIDEAINKGLLEKIKSRAFKPPAAIIGEDYENFDKKIEPCNEPIILKYYCPCCKKEFRIQSLGFKDMKCPTCDNIVRGGNYMIVDAKFKEQRKKSYRVQWYSPKALDSYVLKKNEKFYYMVPHKNGFTLYNIVHEVSMNNGKYIEKYGIESSIIHKLGEEIACYKHLKKGLKEADPFDVLNINSKNFNCPPKIIYDGATDFLHFARENEKAMKMTGFLEVLKYAKRELRLESFFIIFLALVNKYPVLEQVIKSGHIGLFFSLYDKMLSSTNRDDITAVVKSIAQLVNMEATKGTEALRFPTYIGDYLIKKSADIEEYYYWRDIAEITNLTRKEFEDVVNSFNYAYINSTIGFKDIGNILKYGYEPAKLLAYIVKTADKTRMSLASVVDYLADYLTMCEQTGVTPDMFPMDLRKQHDDMIDQLRRSYTQKMDKILFTIGADCEKYMPSDIYDEKGNLKVGIPKLLEDYEIVFPKSEVDFRNEGNMQHNCVASYAKRVSNGECVIFFIRKKESPTLSYITGECRPTIGLNQFLLSNNRGVYNESLIALGKYVSNKILTGVSSGAIRALSNCPKE